MDVDTPSQRLQLALEARLLLGGIVPPNLLTAAHTPIATLLRRLRHSADISAKQSAGGDWSLRANGNTYIDRAAESRVLLTRINHSSATVTGIAGQRGTGKSSLALRVLTKCNADGAFTQLIHSPSGHDPREFIVSIFQTICQEVVTRIGNKIGIEGSLLEHGRAERRRLRRVAFTVFVGFIGALIGVIGYTFIERQVDQLTSASGRLSSYEAEITTAINSLATISTIRLVEMSEPELGLIRSAIDVLSRDPYGVSYGLNNLTRSASSDPIADYLRTLDSAEYESLLSNASADLHGVRWDTRRLLASLRDQEGTMTEVYKWSPRSLVALSIVFAAGFISFRYSRQWWRRMRHAKRAPAEAGLRRAALELGEHLEFETTRSTAAHMGGTLMRLRADKKLASRPLSLPGNYCKVC